jgi:CBS-domain-containing membrane protein
MRRDVSHGYDDEDCAHALAYMLAHHLRYMPVTDHEEHFLGIVSLDELLSALSGSDAGAS